MSGNVNEAGKGSDRSGDECARRTGPGGIQLIRLARALLKSPDFEEALKRTDIPPQRMINPLLCALFEPDEVLRWRVVRAVAITVSAMAEKDLESARIIMRRLMWSLNDESGGIGWGAPEAMGEIMAENETLAREYYRILVSYIDIKGNLLENDELELGAMWGISRLAQKRPELLREWTAPVVAQLKSPHPVKRGLALLTMLAVVPQPGWAVPSALPGAVVPPATPAAAEGLNGHPGCGLTALAELLVPLIEDQSEIRIFQDGSFVEYKICRLASELLTRLQNSPETTGDQQ
ncbi:MAG: DVU0298 family protein [Syntrophobacteraceae bacterium]